MFTLLKYLLRSNQPQNFTGGLVDNRVEVERKEKDITLGEIVASANEVIWQEKYPSKVRKFPDQNQVRSNTCGANALRKAWGTCLHALYGSYIALSREHIYQRRINAPLEGMMLYDMFRIASEGCALEAIVNSKAETDADYDNAKVEPWMVKEGETWKITRGIFVENDIEKIASVIQTTGKGVILMTWFTAGEWSKEIPYIVENGMNVYDRRSLRHFVVAVDFTMFAGKKYLVIEDSAWFGGINRRLVSEDWVKFRVYQAGYLMNFKFEPQPNRPKYDGKTIVSAQECLRAEGLFPTNISFVENVGPVTRTALINFQKKYGLVQSGILEAYTKQKLIELYP